MPVKILITDEDHDSRHLLKVLLTRWGYDPVCVADGDEAWNVLSSRGGPRIALLGLMTSGVDGAEICRRLRTGGHAG